MISLLQKNTCPAHSAFLSLSLSLSCCLRRAPRPTLTRFPFPELQKNIVESPPLSIPRAALFYGAVSKSAELTRRQSKGGGGGLFFQTPSPVGGGGGRGCARRENGEGFAQLLRR